MKKRKHDEEPRVHFMLDAATINTVRELGDAEDCSMASIVRRAMRAYVKRRKSSRPQARRKSLGVLSVLPEGRK